MTTILNLPVCALSGESILYFAAKYIYYGKVGVKGGVAGGAVHRGVGFAGQLLGTAGAGISERFHKQR
jgi:hypothetical protein